MGIIKENPPIPNTNPIPGLSKIAVVISNKITNTGTLQIKNLKSFRRNGRAKMNIPIGIIKNCIPPHDARPNAKKTPPPINLDIVIFLLSDLIPLKNKYNPNNP